ncbi:MAG: hypothetical protein ACHQ4H_06755, partial [Ktedonobacterales bacterium]
MGIIVRYVRWLGHDAGGTLPPVDVLAGLLAGDGRDGARPLALGAEVGGAETARVFVPPQWLGDWETGRALPPGYQYVWYAPRDTLR